MPIGPIWTNRKVPWPILLRLLVTYVPGFDAKHH